MPPGPLAHGAALVADAGYFYLSDPYGHRIWHTSAHIIGAHQGAMAL